MLESISVVREKDGSKMATIDRKVEAKIKAGINNKFIEAKKKVDKAKNDQGFIDGIDSDGQLKIGEHLWRQVQ